MDYARLNHSTISFFDYSRPETAVSRWNRVSLNASKVCPAPFCLNIKKEKKREVNVKRLSIKKEVTFVLPKIKIHFIIFFIKFSGSHFDFW